MWWTSCFFVHLSHQSIAILSDFEVEDRRGKTKRKEKTYLIVLSVSCLLVFRVSQMVLQTPNLLGFQTTAVLLTSDLLFPSPLSLRFSGASFCIDLLQPSSLSSGRSSFMHVPRKRTLDISTWLEAAWILTCSQRGTKLSPNHSSPCSPGAPEGL